MKHKPINDPNKILGECYVCHCPITNLMIVKSKAVYLGKNIYRCRSKKCQKIIIDNFLKRNRKRN